MKLLYTLKFGRKERFDIKGFFDSTTNLLLMALWILISMNENELCGRRKKKIKKGDNDEHNILKLKMKEPKGRI